MHKLLTARGWRRRGFAALLGACATAALPPFFILPLLVPAFCGLFLLIITSGSARRSFWDGWWWGLGHFTTGLYWICISLYVEPEKFAWLTPFALFGLPSVLAIYIGVVGLCLQLAARSRLSPLLLLLLFVTFWVDGEYIRSYLFTGFPWNLIGYVWNASLTTMQTAAVWSVYGQSALAVLLATLPALYFLPSTRLSFSPWFAMVVVLGSVVVYGSWQLYSHPTEFTQTHIRIVQANVPQSVKMDEEQLDKALNAHITLTQRPGLEQADVIIWPETAVPYTIDKEGALTHLLGSVLPPQGKLFAGGMRVSGHGKQWQAWNSAFVINRQGQIESTYDKHHLVPFGEFIPLRGILPVEAIAVGMGDFMRGPGPQTIEVPSLPPFSPLICYEGIFPSEAVNSASSPQWLVSITNDAWFGISSGPYQHLEMVRLRAVEQGVPLVRAANTGISVLTDSYGRILRSLPLSVSGVIDAPLPKPANRYSTHGRDISDLLIVMVNLTSCFAFIFAQLGRSKHYLVD